MHPKLPAIFLALFAIGAYAADPLDCSVSHPSSGKLYDLSPLSRDSGDDWEPDGLDSEYKFKLNVCHSLLYKELDVKNPENIASWAKKTKGTSLGLLSKQPKFRGDNLILEYKDGDECPNAPNYHKSTLIHFTCDVNVEGKGKPVLISETNGCQFVFEWRTPAACPTDRVARGDNGGSSVFWTLIGVFVAVYIIGGVAYNRVVHNARGLKQIPNYKLWAEGLDFIKDMAIILFSKCYRPRRSQSYHNLPIDSEVNTLIDDDDDEV
ncbi:Cation-independent mannose-6-phosphate receptor CI-MPR [Actinomortierella ambigua]|uniref:Cation-independent mannose-6-phosphate receptor CI-MPR n=1 Tax=Actinomortierella ambigua TaxID=1343610 RepID=A0A9P6QJW0_9FUNG|nr:Cation-independent mannose-6-phosphate receptor CI-MPR [Actinomortierella ambigua]KAG0267447.1 Cation-independent mannose-6-phosphate receptor CI-MPR [Actinomortierella ambigua]